MWQSVIYIISLSVYKLYMQALYYQKVLSWTTATWELKLEATLKVWGGGDLPLWEVKSDRDGVDGSCTLWQFFFFFFLFFLLEDFQSVGRKPQAERNIWFIHNRYPHSQAVTGAAWPNVTSTWVLPKTSKHNHCCTERWHWLLQSMGGCR